MKTFKLTHIKGLSQDQINDFHEFYRFAVQTHDDCNCVYGISRFQLHLDSVINNGIKYINLVPEEDRFAVLCGCAGHDLIEDCRLAYNDVADRTNEKIAEIILCCTNTIERTRTERLAGAYEKIKHNDLALFVKLCDRITNLKFSVFNDPDGHHYKKYVKEHTEFRKQLYNGNYQVMWDILETLVNF